MESHCIVLSAAILSGLDTSQDPCENFYDYVSEYSCLFQLEGGLDANGHRQWMAQGESLACRQE